MAKPKNPNRIKAFELFEKHRGDITNRAIAQNLDVPEKTISVWKYRDKWIDNIGGEVRSTTKKKRSTTKKVSSRDNQKEQVVNALVEAGSYSPALDLLTDIYLDAYEEYERLKSEGIADEKSRRELARLLGQLGLDGKNKELIKKSGVLLEKQEEKDKKEKEVPQNNTLLQFRQRMSK